MVKSAQACVAGEVLVRLDSSMARHQGQHYGRLDVRHVSLGSRSIIGFGPSSPSDIVAIDQVSIVASLEMGVYRYSARPILCLLVLEVGNSAVTASGDKKIKRGRD